MKHLIAAGTLVVVVTIAIGLLLSNATLLPDQASVQAQAIDVQFEFHFWAIAFLFSLIVVFMLYSVVVFRRRKGETGDGEHIEGNTTVEITWTILPLFAVMGLAFWGSDVLAETQRAATDALEIRVIGQQWVWRFEYPEEGIVSSELVLPVNRQAVLMLESQDVIHSFWVPEFRVKQDALPGGVEMIRDLRVTPSKVGAYKVLCAELCGQQHSEMRADVRVLSVEEYEAWVIEQQTSIPDDPVLRGQKWATDFGCAACHSVDGTVVVGPSWKGIFGSQEPLEDGSSVLVDEAYLLESIVNPAAKIVAGFPNVMQPSLAEALTDEQIADIIEYIKSLE